VADKVNPGAGVGERYTRRCEPRRAARPVAIVPGSHGGFNRIGELNDRIAAFIIQTADQGPPTNDGASAEPTTRS
jgi:hypothetical protein